MKSTMNRRQREKMTAPAPAQSSIAWNSRRLRGLRPSNSYVTGPEEGPQVSAEGPIVWFCLMLHHN